MLQAKINYTYGVYHQLNGNSNKAEDYYLMALKYFNKKSVVGKNLQ